MGVDDARITVTARRPCVNHLAPRRSRKGTLMLTPAVVYATVPMRGRDAGSMGRMYWVKRAPDPVITYPKICCKAQELPSGSVKYAYRMPPPMSLTSETSIPLPMSVRRMTSRSSTTR
jgi:hypothetical protein